LLIAVHDAGVVEGREAKTEEIRAAYEKFTELFI